MNEWVTNILDMTVRAENTGLGSQELQEDDVGRSLGHCNKVSYGQGQGFYS